jgi:hypothetical protein
MTRIQNYLRHPEQASGHWAYCAGYYRLQQRIDLFRLRYAVPNVTPDRVEAIKDLDKALAEAEAPIQKQLAAGKSPSR